MFVRISGSRLAGVPCKRGVKAWRGPGGRAAAARAPLRALAEHARVYVLRTDQQTTFRWYYSHYTCGNKIKKLQSRLRSYEGSANRIALK